MVLEGANVCMSPLNGARFTDIRISGSAPESYERLLSGYCTAYHFNKGVWGASGMYLYQGFVAVDPSVIPYGSLLYITNSDGSFVYGWAIAADYCQASAEGRVLCDLFFDTYEEPYLYGKHYMNVYVVKQLYRDELQEFVARQGYFDNRVAGRPYTPPAPEPEPEPAPEEPSEPVQPDPGPSGEDQQNTG
jgi:3D (Asp-Asp-Asp) domain-containing protein